MIANRIAYGETLIELAKEREDIVVLDADAGKSTGVLPFLKVFPDRYIQCGIAEQNMVGIAAGLAACGLCPFLATFAVFTSMRAVEQVRNSVCYSNLNVKVTGTHAGLETGGDGGTHQAVEDIAIMRALPGMRVLTPSTPNATRKLTRLAAEKHGPFYIRLGKDPAPEFYGEEELFPLGGSKELRSGAEAAILSCGNMLSRVIEAADLLEKEGIHARVLDMYSVKPIDREAIVRAAHETQGLVTVEDHVTIGGLGGAVAEILTQYAPAKLTRVGLEDTFGRSGIPLELYKLFGLTPEAIAEAVRELLK
ncbi:MAG: hypothetical protein LBR61_13970 [Synergistaceae bacterium]|jgi:transketolase|nr:hypothetical protein [Synergistaceae bacterium]